jgi:hypothetical protein
MAPERADLLSVDLEREIPEQLRLAGSRLGFRPPPLWVKIISPA